MPNTNKPIDHLGYTTEKGFPHTSASSTSPNTNESKMPEVKNCPFCHAAAKPHDGDFVISHSIDCFFTQQYAGEMWLISKRGIGQWNHRTDKVNMNTNESETPRTDAAITGGLNPDDQYIEIEDCRKIEKELNDARRELEEAKDALRDYLSRCPDCGGNGVIVTTKSGHACDGTEESCARNCPVPVQDQEPCQWCDRGLTVLNK